MLVTFNHCFISILKSTVAVRTLSFLPQLVPDHKTKPAVGPLVTFIPVSTSNEKDF